MREGTTILTLDNGYHLWTHTDNVGGKIRLLCLHGGPGGNHEYYENFAEKLKDIDVQVTSSAHGILISRISPSRKTLMNF